MTSARLRPFRPFAWFGAMIVAFVLANAPQLARADDGARATKVAKAHYDKGEKLFNLGKFDDALVEYQKAYDAKPLPLLLFNIAQCYRNLGETDSAIFTYKKYLRADPDASNRENVQVTIEKLEKEKERGESERLKLTGPRPVAKPEDGPIETPVYKKWWFWTGLAVVSVAGGFGIYEATRSGPMGTDLGSISFPK